MPESPTPEPPVPAPDVPLRFFMTTRLLFGILADTVPDLAPVLRELGLPPDAREQTWLTVSREQFTNLCATTERLTGDSNLGLTMARRLTRGAYGLLDFGVRSAPTVGDAFQVLLRFQRLMDETSTFRMQTDRGRVILEHYSLPAVRAYNEYVTGVIVQFVRELTGKPFALIRAWFANPRPADTTALEELLGTRELDFGGLGGGMLFDAALLSTPLTTADPALYKLMLEQAEQALASLPQRSDLVAQVREQARAALEAGQDPSIERVAVRLDVGARTLQRRLSERNTSFADVLEELRESLARLWLADPEPPLAQIVERLGYSDLRAFDRAFKRWTGLSPTEYRRSGPR